MVTEKTRVLAVLENAAEVDSLRATAKEYADGEFEWIHASCLKDSLKRMSEDGVDVVLLDLSLPEAPGLETMRKFQEADPKTPIVVLTGDDNEKLALQALQGGAVGYFRKNRLEGDSLARALCYSAEHKRRAILQKLESMEDGPSRSTGLLTRLGPKKPREAGLRGNGDGVEDAADAKDAGSRLADLLEKGKVEAYFQPWISLRAKTVVGVEGLCRGVGEDGKTLIPPLTLLRWATRFRRLSALNRLFRRKTLESFEPASRQDPDLLLSVNLDAGLLEDGVSGFEDFLPAVQEHHLDPGHIVIELFESKPCDVPSLKKFIDSQHAAGFLIALENVRLGYSNLDTVSELAPDLIKADRSILAGIEKNYCKQEMLRSLVHLVHGIGALLVAEGVETEAEAMLALKLGADMVQGFYFSEPQKMGEGFLAGCAEKIEETFQRFKGYAQSINLKRSLYQKHTQMIRLMAEKLSAASPQTFDIKLLEVTERHPEVERMFVLDKDGTQLSRMVGTGSQPGQKKVFFKPPERGTDHSLKDYFYCLIKSYRKDFAYFTDPYLSPSTGRACVTLSTLFKDAYGHTSVLCVDVKPEFLLA